MQQMMAFNESCDTLGGQRHLNIDVYIILIDSSSTGESLIAQLPITQLRQEHGPGEKHVSHSS